MLPIVNFLDVTFNLSNNSFKPFHKENQTPTYININSNHPRSIIKQIPKSVNIRINRISSDNKIFNENIRMYNEALEKSGYKHRLEYLEKIKDNIDTNFGSYNCYNNRSNNDNIGIDSNSNRHSSGINDNNSEERMDYINSEHSTFNSSDSSNNKKEN